jgi:molecular chaperone HtpG
MVTTDVLEFQAEAKELLDIVIHSLYTEKDIFLRELISNASDALDRFQFEVLTAPGLNRVERSEIRLIVDREARTLAVSDNGIGMTRDEVVANIGTIAKSGTKDLRRRLAQGDSPAQIGALIGQFGVGFYSAFMVADRVTLVTRRAGDAAATEWESDGNGTYSIRDGERASCGTTVTLHLKAPDAESGIEDYADTWWLSKTVKKYSDYIRYPIVTVDARPPAAGADSQSEDRGDLVLNSMKPMWKRPAAEVTSDEHATFYREISHDWNAPLKSIRLQAEGAFEYDALLYIPTTAPYDLYYVAPRTGLRLFANCVLIMEECQELLPAYLRFIRGVVDVGDLALNISRQRLQQDHHIGLIKKKLTRKVLDTLQQLFEHDREQYLRFWAEFGRALKEGISSDFENKDRILSLTLFHSSKSEDRPLSLAEYVARMPAEQEQIFYVTGESRDVLESSPHLEAFKRKGYEVLYMTDPVDELLLQHVSEFEGRKLKSAAKGSIALGSEEERQEAEKTLTEMTERYKPLLDFLQKTLETHVKQVRLSSRLTESPVCLVVEDHEESPLLERVLQRNKGRGARRRRVLELNPTHPLVSRLRDRADRGDHDELLRSASEVLFGLALLLEHSELPDPVAFNRAALDLLNGAV